VNRFSNNSSWLHFRRSVLFMVSFISVASLASGCSDSSVPSQPSESRESYTYEPIEVTGSTIMVLHPSYEPHSSLESESPSE
jgi:hypothetical protein